jgi:hypothetical protein
MANAIMVIAVDFLPPATFAPCTGRLTVASDLTAVCEIFFAIGADIFVALKMKLETAGQSARLSEM